MRAAASLRRVEQLFRKVSEPLGHGSLHPVVPRRARRGSRCILPRFVTLREGGLMSVLTGFVALAFCIALLAPATASAGIKDRPGGKSAVTCNLPESNAEALVILSNHYPGYWWDHTNLTIAVQA